MTKTLCVVALIALWGQQVCGAQAVDPWERVKLVEPGRSVTVKLHNGPSVSGTMREWSPEGITLVQGKTRVSQIAKADVERVSMATGMSRGKRAGWAALIGGAIGGGLLGGVCAGVGDCETAAVIAGGAIYVGGIAAGVAALIPQHKDVIYRAPARKP